MSTGTEDLSNEQILSRLVDANTYHNILKEVRANHNRALLQTNGKAICSAKAALKTSEEAIQGVVRELFQGVQPEVIIARLKSQRPQKKERRKK